MKQGKILILVEIIFLIFLVIRIQACTHDPVLDNIPEICFERDVLPVFQNSCAISGCHSGSGGHNFALNSYASISRSVVPGKPYQSEIYKAIISTSGENKMPPSQPLSLENRTKIRLWIEQGAAETTCSLTEQIPGYSNPLACFSRDILPVITSKCASTGCHDAASHKEGYVFNSYSTILAAVTPGNTSSSKLYNVIKIASGEEKMPPAGKPQLTVAEIDSIGSWIKKGALNEYCGEVCDTINPVTFSGIIWPQIQTSCTGCHSGATPGGGILLANYGNVATAASSGILVKSLKGTGVTKMPLGGSFSSCKIRQFELWVKDGYLNN